MPNSNKKIEIAGQYYELRIEASNNINDGQDCFTITLKNKEQSRMIPGGIKLRLLTVDGQEFAGNEVEAKQAIAKLQIKVWLNPGEGIIWETIPSADNYQPNSWFRPK